MGVYMAITNGRGTVPFRLQLTDVDEEREALWFAEGEVEFSDPRAVVELDFMMTGVTFPTPGEYRFQFFACGERIMERRILVNQLPEVPQ